MKVAAGYGARYAAAAADANSMRPKLPTMIWPRAFKSQLGLWYCPECLRSRAFTSAASRANIFPRKRTLSTTARRSEEVQKPPEQHTEKLPVSDRSATSTSAALPSNTDNRRWQMSRRLSHMMDNLLAKAGIWGQHINIYTGTDYSGIEALRKDIEMQEQRVESSHVSIDNARSSHHEAHTKQRASQKEIVSLLERKSSWSPEDLERYMSLVRSEHTDEQAVQTAKDGMNAAERELENARAELERLERKQYHEEQIWSDTIRRNSTWVTFGLMGVNIVLLLAQITIFEPYRRRKIVRDVNQALEEKTLVATASAVEKQIDEVVEPRGVSIEAVEGTSPEIPLDAVIAVDPGSEIPTGVALEPSSSAPTLSQLGQPKTWSGRWEHYKESLQDLFSERIIQVKKVDITTTALQGAATGVATIGLLFVLWRPK